MATSYGAVNPQLLQRKKHSGLGIASFVLSMFNGLAMLSAVVWIIVEAESETSQPSDTWSAIQGLILMLTAFMAVVGLGIGVCALFQKNKGKAFSIFGIVINAAIILVFIFLIVGGKMLKKLG